MKYTSANMHKQGGKWRGFLEYRDADGKRRKRSKVLRSEGKKAARAELEAWRAEMEARAEQEAAKERHDPATIARETPLADYVSAYIDEQEAAHSIERSTIRGYRSTCKLISELEGETVGSITADKAAAWEASLTARGLSSSTVGKAHRLLKQVLQHWAIQRDRALPFNPLEQVKPPKRKKVKEGINALAAPERAKLLEALATTGLTPMTVASYISLYMGLRIGEVCGLQWRDIDLDAGVMNITHAIGNGKGEDGSGEYLKATKTDKPRSPKMPTELISILREWREEQREDWRGRGWPEPGRESFVVGDCLGWAHPDVIRREYNALIKLLGIRGTMGRPPGFHDLRHTWATMALAGGMDAVTAAIYLGHAKPSMTLDIYATAAPEQIARAAEIVGEVIRPKARDGGGLEPERRG